MMKVTLGTLLFIKVSAKIVTNESNKINIKNWRDKMVDVFDLSSRFKSEKPKRIEDSALKFLMAGGKFEESPCKGFAFNQ